MFSHKTILVLKKKFGATENSKCVHQRKEKKKYIYISIKSVKKNKIERMERKLGGWGGDGGAVAHYVRRGVVRRFLCKEQNFNTSANDACKARFSHYFEDVREGPRANRKLEKSVRWKKNAVYGNRVINF